MASFANQLPPRPAGFASQQGAPSVTAPSYDPADQTLIELEGAIYEALGHDAVLSAVYTAVKSSGQIASDTEVRAQAAYFVKMAQRYIEDRNSPVWKKLVQCSPASVVSSVVQLAQSNLEADLGAQTGFLVPRKHKGVLVCTPCPGVRGLERNLMRSGIVQTIKSFAVCAQDQYEFVQGGDEDPKLRRNLHPDLNKPNPIVASFTRIVLKDGTKHIVEKPIDASSLSAERSTPEKTAEYISARAAMRDVIRTYLFDTARYPALTTLVAMEDQVTLTTEAIESRQLKEGVLDAYLEEPAVAPPPPVLTATPAAQPAAAPLPTPKAPGPGQTTPPRRRLI